jgi:hypothetical protein
MISTGPRTRYFSNGHADPKSAPFIEDFKLDAELVTKLVNEPFTPPSKVILKIETQAADRADKLLKAPSPKPADNNPSNNNNEDGDTEADKKADKDKVTVNYEKETNFKSVTSTSLITQSLIEHRSMSAGRIEERQFKIKVYLHILQGILPNASSEMPPLTLNVTPSMIVDDVIFQVLVQYNREMRKPLLVLDANLFELRTYSEDDDDDDDFALDRQSEIKKCGVRVVTLTKASNASVELLYVPERVHHASIAVGDNLTLFKVMFEAQSYVVQCPREGSLEKLLYFVSKKRKENMSPEQFEFVLNGKVLDFSTVASEVKSENIELRRKGAASLEVKVIPSSTGATPKPSDFFFTKETASVYKEYEVIKQKNRIKQRRIMGIDASRIYNLAPTEAKDNSISFTVRISSLGPIKRKFRSMTDVVKAEIDPEHPKSFQILYRDLETNAIVPYKFEATNEYECAEIVAKVEFLRKLS